jgi:CubicO group peptidase (beta-lactamase class C family)
MSSLVVALASVTPAAAGDREKALDERVRQMVALKFKIGSVTPGVAVAVYQPGVLEYAEGFGLANLRTKDPITPTTRFELASVSKPFTAIAVLVLEGQGKLKLDDPVGKYIPELPKATGEKVRITDLLHHTSGLPDYMKMEDVPRANKKFWTNDDFVPQFAKQWGKLEKPFEPGEKCVYSNTNYMLLATVVERVAKVKFSAFLEKYVFRPAGMKHSFVFDRPTEPDRHPNAGRACAVGYAKTKSGKPPWKVSWGLPPDSQEAFLTYGDGAVWSSLEDLLVFDKAIRDGKLLPKGQFDRMLEPIRTKNGKVSEHGLAWALGFDTTGKVAVFEHTGNWGDFNTRFLRSVDRDRTIVVLSNLGGFDPVEFTEALWKAVDEVLQ